MKRFLWYVGFIIVAIILGAWAGGYVMLPPGMTKPQYAGKILSADADPVLRVSCFDCHSNEAHYTWIDYLPVATSIVAHDVIKGRKKLNFSLWSQYSQTQKQKKLQEVRREIDSGDMPPWYYTLPHRDAALSPRAKQILLSALPAAVPSAGGDEEDSDEN